LIRIFSGDGFVELFQALELGCEATFGSGVDDEDDFAAVLG